MKLRFSMPELSFEEKEEAFKLLFNLERPKGWLGTGYYYAWRAFIHVTGWLPNSVYAKISDIKDNQLLILVECMRYNPTWSRAHSTYLQDFEVKKLESIQTDDLLGDLLQFIGKVSETGNNKFLAEFLKKHPEVDLNQPTQPYSFTPLMCAAWRGKIDNIKALVSANAKIEAEMTQNSDQITDVLLVAAQGNENEALKFLIETYGSKFKSSQLLRVFLFSMGNKKITDEICLSIFNNLSELTEEDALKVLVNVIFTDRFSLLPRILSDPKIAPFITEDFLNQWNHSFDKERNKNQLLETHATLDVTKEQNPENRRIFNRRESNLFHTIAALFPTKKRLDYLSNRWDTTFLDVKLIDNFLSQPNVTKWLTENPDFLKNYQDHLSRILVQNKSNSVDWYQKAAPLLLVIQKKYSEITAQPS